MLPCAQKANDGIDGGEGMVRSKELRSQGVVAVDGWVDGDVCLVSGGELLTCWVAGVASGLVRLTAWVSGGSSYREGCRESTALDVVNVVNVDVAEIDSRSYMYVSPDEHV